jgi:hypothetical protein
MISLAFDAADIIPDNIKTISYGKEKPYLRRAR